MMESKKQRFNNVNFLEFLVITLCLLCTYSCTNKTFEELTLECIIKNIDCEEGANIVIEQNNGWSDSTILIILTCHTSSIELDLRDYLQGYYNENTLYYRQMNIDSTDLNEYSQVPNNILWEENSSKYEEIAIPPPYDPISVQIEYNTKEKCIGNIIIGEEFLMDDFEVKCNNC